MIFKKGLFFVKHLNMLQQIVLPTMLSSFFLSTQKCISYSIVVYTNNNRSLIFQFIPQKKANITKITSKK